MSISDRFRLMACESARFGARLKDITQIYMHVYMCITYTIYLCRDREEKKNVETDRKRYMDA